MENNKNTTFLQTKKKPKMDITKITIIAVLSALGIIIAHVIKFPLIPGVEYMKYDPDNIPVLLVTIMFGPAAGIMSAIIVVGAEALLHSTTGFWGILMHFMSSSSVVLVVGLILKIKPKQVLLALSVGAVIAVFVMTGANLLITPIYTGFTLEAVKDMVLPVIIPFNIIKEALNTIITYLLYLALKGKVKYFNN